MTKHRIPLFVGVLALAVGAASDARAAKKDPTTITCEEFVALGSSVQPRVAAFLAGYAKGKEKIDAVGEVDVDRELTAVIDVCVQEPKAGVWDKLRAKLPGGKKKVKAVDMTCETFMALSETQRPEVAYWLAGYDRAKNTQTDVAGEVDLDKDLAYVLVDCKPTPKESVWQKIKAKF